MEGMQKGASTDATDGEPNGTHAMALEKAFQRVLRYRTNRSYGRRSLPKLRTNPRSTPDALR